MLKHAGDRRAAGPGGLLQRRRGGGARPAPALHPRRHAPPARVQCDAAQSAESTRGGGRGLSTDAASEVAGALVGRVGHQPALNAPRSALRRPGARDAPRGLRGAWPLPRATFPRGPAPRAGGAPPRSWCGGDDGRECALVVSFRPKPSGQAGQGIASPPGSQLNLSALGEDDSERTANRERYPIQEARSSIKLTAVPDVPTPTAAAAAAAEGAAAAGKSGNTNSNPATASKAN